MGFVEAMIQFQNDHPNLDTGTWAAIQDNFGSVLTSMMALFQCMTGGEVWGPVYRLVSRSGPIYSSIFIFFITFMVFALFNIVTSIFVDKAMNLASSDIEYARLLRAREDMSAARKLVDLFEAFDEDGTGTISKEELHRITNDDHVRLMLAQFDLNVLEAD